MGTPLKRSLSRDTAPPAAPTQSPASIAPYQQRAVETLVDLGLSKEEVVALKKLGFEGAQKLLNLLLREGEAGMESLLRPIEDVEEQALQKFLGVDATKKDMVPAPARPTIDNPTATAGYLQLPVTPTTGRTQSLSPSSTTEITHPSKGSKRQKVAPKTPFIQRYCPSCGHKLKYGFEEHFRSHLQQLFAGLTVGEGDLLGCGFCPVENPHVDEGKAFLGANALLHHIFDNHSLSPTQLQWSFNALFNNLLLGERTLRQHYRDFINLKDEEFKSTQMPYQGRPVLSWVNGSGIPDLLANLQRLGGRLKGVPSNPGIPSTHVNESVEADRVLVDQLLGQAYRHAGVIQRPVPQSSSKIDVSPIQPAAGERDLFRHLGGGAYDPPQPDPTKRVSKKPVARTPVAPMAHMNPQRNMVPQNFLIRQNHNTGLQAQPTLPHAPIDTKPNGGGRPLVQTNMPPPPLNQAAPLQGMNMQIPQTLPPFQGGNDFLSQEDLDRIYNDPDLWRE